MVQALRDLVILVDVLLLLLDFNLDVLDPSLDLCDIMVRGNANTTCRDGVGVVAGVRPPHASRSCARGGPEGRVRGEGEGGGRLLLAIVVVLERQFVDRPWPRPEELSLWILPVSPAVQVARSSAPPPT